MSKETFFHFKVKSRHFEKGNRNEKLISKKKNFFFIKSKIFSDRFCMLIRVTFVCKNKNIYSLKMSQARLYILFENCNFSFINESF